MDGQGSGGNSWCQHSAQWPFDFGWRWGKVFRHILFFPLLLRHPIDCCFETHLAFASTYIVCQRFPTHRALLLASCTHLAQLCSIEREEDVVHLPLTASSTIRCFLYLPEAISLFLSSGASWIWCTMASAPWPSQRWGSCSSLHLPLAFISLLKASTWTLFCLRQSWKSLVWRISRKILAILKDF